MAIGTPTKATLPTVPRAEIMVDPKGKRCVAEFARPDLEILF